MPDPSNPATTRWNDDPSRRWRKRRRRFRRRMRRGFDVLLVVLIVVAFALAIRHSTTTSKGHKKVATTAITTAPSAVADVKITGCHYSNYAALANLRITNHLALDQNYVVKVLFKDGTALYARAVATVDHLPAGATDNVVASGISTQNPPTQLNCYLYVVQRFGG